MVYLLELLTKRLVSFKAFARSMHHLTCNVRSRSLVIWWGSKVAFPPREEHEFRLVPPQWTPYMGNPLQERSICHVEVHCLPSVVWGKVVVRYKTTKGRNSRHGFPRRVQKEWCCASCLISTPSEECLIRHFQGKKHNAKEGDLQKLTKKNGKSPPMFKVKVSQIVVDHLNRLTANLGNNCKFLSPVGESITLCKWEKPQLGWIKLNTDGSVSPESAGFGGLLRDCYGDPICAFVSKAPRDDSFLVELWAIWRGLVLAQGLGIKAIWVESDSSSVVNTINRTQSHYLAITFTCLKHIWKLLRKFDKHKVSHSSRKTNAAADYLAKMNLSGNDVVLWPDDFPEELRMIVEEDARGSTYSRDNS